MRGALALIAALAAFVVPAAMMGLALAGLSDPATVTDLLKTWLAYIGPFAGTVLGYYFTEDKR